jgi:hypothetical protein
MKVKVKYQRFKGPIEEREEPSLKDAIFSCIDDIEFNESYPIEILCDDVVILTNQEIREILSFILKIYG